VKDNIFITAYYGQQNRLLGCQFSVVVTHWTPST